MTSSSWHCRTASRVRSPSTFRPTRSWSIAAPITGSSARADWAAFYEGPYFGAWDYGMPELVLAGRWRCSGIASPVRAGSRFPAAT